MRVTTRGITIAAGILIVLSLGAAWLRVVREESGSSTAADTQQCVAQPRQQARKAQQRFSERYLEPAAEEGGPEWFVGDAVSRREAVGAALAEDVGPGWVLLVLYLDDGDLPALPRCIEDTPVAYVASDGQVEPD